MLNEMECSSDVTRSRSTKGRAVVEVDVGQLKVKVKVSGCLARFVDDWWGPWRRSRT